MEDGRWFRFLTIGLILASIVVGYFIFTGKFSAKKETVVQVPTPQETQVPNNDQEKNESVLGEQLNTSEPNTATQSAFNTIAQRTKGGVEELPKTGFSIYLWSVISASAAVAGWSLRKFPK